MESFTDNGINDFEVGVALWEALQIKDYDLKDPQFADRLREISDYFEKHPDGPFTIRSVSSKNKMKVELTKEQIENLLVLVDRSQIGGNAAETIVEIKNALKKGLNDYEKQPAKEDK